jgi:hypothetical protein
LGGVCAYLSLQIANKQPTEDLARLVAVADVFEGFGCVLAAYVEEDFFAASVCEEKCVSRSDLLIYACDILPCHILSMHPQMESWAREDKAYGCSSTKLEAL